ncbi:hypothetical protein BT93_E1345 [Corymbia citriodora subsp. variegata]|nr:hypothetical protein BT93_E1345 [Corymbia citriodora subsp. variegata]
MVEPEHETGSLAHVMRDMEKNFKFALEMIFLNELEAYNKYVAYAISKGFGVRKGNLARNTKGEITRWTFVCNCEARKLLELD